MITKVLYCFSQVPSENIIILVNSSNTVNEEVGLEGKEGCYFSFSSFLFSKWMPFICCFGLASSVFVKLLKIIVLLLLCLKNTAVVTYAETRSFHCFIFNIPGS